LAKDWSTLTQWTEKAIGLSDVRVQVRLRGNHLHILCESTPCPREKIAVSQFSIALEQTSLSTLLPPEAPPVYKVFLCGRQPGAKRPEWTVKLECNPSQAATNEALTLPSPPFESDVPNTEKSVWEKLGGIWSRRPPTTEDEPHEHPVAEAESISTKNLEAEKAQPLEMASPDRDPRETAAQPYEPIDRNPSPVSDYPHNRPNGQRELSPITERLSSHQSELENPSSTGNSRATATQTKPSELTPSEPIQAPLTVSTETLARRGHSQAIASYLSEILGNLGVSVKVSVKERSKHRSASTTETSTRRLWVRCESAYSPDPSLLAEPIAERLRQLQLENFRDACILLQVQGEPRPDWMLRIDLTPPVEILKNWARWGSQAAIARILNQKLEESNVKVRATLKESTLHLFCETLNLENVTSEPAPPRPKNKRNAPAKAKVMAAIAPILDTLAPQGILAATVYGVDAQNPAQSVESPIWIDWLNLPAHQHQDLQHHPLTLAQQGNLEALTFLLNQLINPDLDHQLATGGVRVLLLRKGKLLHVMTEAPTCPSQSKVALPLAQFLRTHKIEGVAGVRIYGRRAGQKHPLWRYGVALSQRSPTLDEQVNGFSESEHPELMTQTEGLVWRPDLASDELEGQESLPSNRRRLEWSDPLELLSMRLQQGLLATGLFVSREAVLAPIEAGESSSYSKTGLALIWGALGCLLAVQVDWAMGQFLENNPQLEMAIAAQNLPSVDQPPTTSQPVSAIETTTSLTGESPEENEVFNRSEFLSQPQNRTQLNACQTASNVEACQLSQLLYPSFNSPQLDEQFARYQEYIATEKRPPDILIVGSSRALRGIDPEVLEKALVEAGYPQLKVFNFGVNGATAQVVELIVRRILPPEQLPKLVIVADGVRALNGGRSDRTYETIAASAGYQEIAQGTFRIPTRQLKSASNFKQTLLTLKELSQNPSTVIKQIQDWFNQRLIEISASYPQRDRLKQGLLALVNHQNLLTQSQDLPDLPDAEDNPTLETPQLGSNGFLPLSIQFDPETYYQKYSQVSGYYDRDYQGFELSGVQTNALKKLVEYVQSQDVEIVFVNMPLTQEYLDSVRTAYEEKFLEHMQQLEAETGLIFVNLAFEWLDTYEYYSDPSHLNQYGAAAVAERLVQKQQISWPTSR
jgi:lysophospholipase L1-like esterase